jgi:hypothetical protein
MVKYYNLLSALKVATAMLVETLKKVYPFYVAYSQQPKLNINVIYLEVCRSNVLFIQK